MTGLATDVVMILVFMLGCTFITIALDGFFS